MKYLLGPEIIWLLVYLAAILLVKNHLLPPKSLDEFIVDCWYWIPILALLTFALYWVPFAGKNMLMPRIWIVCLVCGHLTLDYLMSAHSQQGPGIGTAYLAGMIFTFIALIVGSIAIKIIH